MDCASRFKWLRPSGDGRISGEDIDHIASDFEIEGEARRHGLQENTVTRAAIAVIEGHEEFEISVRRHADLIEWFRHVKVNTSERSWARSVEEYWTVSG